MISNAEESTIITKY